MKILNVIQPVRTHLQHLASAVAGALILTGLAQAEMIVNVQFYVTGTTASMTDIQGPVASATTTPYWNQFTGTKFHDTISGYPGPNALNMADGTASGISLAMVGNWFTDGFSGGAGQIPVFFGLAFMEDSTETQTALFSGLKTDGTKYALYALGSAVPTSDTRLTLGAGTPVGATPTAIRLRGGVRPGANVNIQYDSTMNLTEWVTTSTDAAGDDFASTANTAYFAELTPDVSGNLSVVLSYANDHHWSDEYGKPFAGVAGYQLVELAGTVIGTPTLSVTNSPVIYDGSAHAAVVVGSVDGTVSNVKYNGSSDVPTALGTYAVTADFAPVDNTNYSSLTAAPAGNFVIENMIVNVQFYIAGTTASMTDIQGPVASATTTPYWNQFTGTQFHDTISDYPGPNALKMADGTASGISLTMAGNWLTDGTNRGSGEIPVFWGVAFMENSSETQTASFSGLKTDGTTYALYALGSVVPTADTRLTLGTDTTPVGATPTAIRLRGAVDATGNPNPGPENGYDSTMNLTQWVYATTDAADDDFASTANTAYFAELTPDSSGKLSVVLSYANQHHWNDTYPKPFAGVAGYQLVELAGTPPGNDYASWALTHSVTGGVSGDSNHDGVPNGVAYFMGLTGPLTNPGLNASNMVTWRMSATFQGTYEVQTSPDLGTWTNVTPRPTATGGYLTYTLPSGLGKQFVRLVVTPN